MRVLHVPYTYYPDPVGGTEVYVASLVRELARLGITSAVAAPGEPATYAWEGAPVHRLPTEPVSEAAALYDEGDPITARAFGAVLDVEQPDVVHLHARTRAVSLRLVREAKRYGLPVVLTYHTPTVSCARGTLLRWGRTVCDGALDARRCAACALQAKGLPRIAASALVAPPPRWGRRLPSGGSMRTSLHMRGFVEQGHAHVRALLREVDHVVAVCDWVRALLLRLGLEPERVTLNRQGLSEVPEAPPSPRQRTRDEPLRLVFLGRLDPTKGLDVVLRALQRIPQAPFLLDAYAVRQAEADAYTREVERLVAADPRVSLRAPVPVAEVVPLLQGYDALVVPSQWLETGPLVVYEAFGAGTPVIGSDLGGIRELVRDGVNGLLVPPNEVHAWVKALRYFAEDEVLGDNLRHGVPIPRHMRDVAREMHELYVNLGYRTDLQ